MDEKTDKLINTIKDRVKDSYERLARSGGSMGEWVDKVKEILEFHRCNNDLVTWTIQLDHTGWPGVTMSLSCRPKTIHVKYQLCKEGEIDG